MCLGCRGKAEGRRRVTGETPLNRGWKGGNSRTFFLGTMESAATREACVRLCCRGKTEKSVVLLVRETFEIVVGKEETLGKFFIEVCGERTDQRGVCVSPL